MKRRFKVALVLILVPVCILLAVVEYQHFERKALEQRLIDIATTHPEFIALRKDTRLTDLFTKKPHIYREEKGQWGMMWSYGCVPCPRIIVHIDRDSEEVTNVFVVWY